MPRSTESRPRKSQHVTGFERVCVMVVLLAIAALIAWVITQAGGGHMLT